MLESVLINKNPINNALIENSKTDTWIITSTKTTKMKELVKVLEQFKEATLKIKILASKAHEVNILQNNDCP